MKRGVLEPEPGVVIRILELPNTFLAHTGYFPIQLGLTYRYQEPRKEVSRILSCNFIGVFLPRGTILLHLSVSPGHEAREGPAQATGHLRAWSAHQKICECMLCPLVFVGTINCNDEDCDLQGPSSVAGWLAGHRFGPLCSLVASRHSVFACWWHVHSTTDTWNKCLTGSVLVGARTHIELT